MAETTALGWSITANIDGNRQIVLQSFFAADASAEEANAQLDFANAILDRQRAKYEIPDLEKEASKLRDEISQAEQDIAEAQVNHDKAQASLDEQIAKLQGLSEDEFKAGYANHRNTGRQGSYTPKGATKANMERIETDINRASEAKSKNDGERDQFLANIGIALNRRRDRIKEIEARLGELRGQLG